MHDLTIRTERDLGRKPYRFKCRFVIEARPTRESLKRGALKSHDLFVRDMAKQGWEYLSSEPPRLRGPFTPVIPMTVHVRRPPTSREMLHMVAQGAPFRFRAEQETLAQTVTPLSMNESWEYELSLVFVGRTIRFEVPDRHEEKVGSR